jgi:hypothetical protein
MNRALLVDLVNQELTADHHTTTAPHHHSTTTPQYQTITVSITTNNTITQSTLLMS